MLARLYIFAVARAAEHFCGCARSGEHFCGCARAVATSNRGWRFLRLIEVATFFKVFKNLSFFSQSVGKKFKPKCAGIYFKKAPSERGGGVICYNANSMPCIVQLGFRNTLVGCFVLNNMFKQYV